MENKLLYVSLAEIHVIKEKLKSINTFFLVEIDGKKVKELSDYLIAVSELFEFPIPAHGLDGYNDWMRDLEWIGKEKIILIIYNYDEFLKFDLHSKKLIIEGFENLILPWWQSEVAKYVVEGKTKSFQVYFVN